MKNILAISGSLRKKSTNLSIIEHIKNEFANKLSVEIYEDLAKLPHFEPDADNENVSDEVTMLRSKIENADGVLICSPEYVFSIPSILKNALEWCVSSASFHNKPTAIITASTSGEKAHESLCLVVKTIDAKVSEDTQLLISHAQTKIKNGKIIDIETAKNLNLLINSFLNKIDE